MRNYSTKESIAAGEVSRLACVESVVAVGIALWLAFWFHSFSHYKVAVCLAPLLLLRTERSTELALRWFERGLNRIQPLGGSEWRETVAVVICAPAALLLAKFASVAWTAGRHPIYTLGALPANWNRVILSTDLAQPPELVPGGDQHPVRKSLSFADETFNHWLEVLRSERGWERMRTLTSGVLVFLPSILYRFSLKSTCPVYLPLLFVLRRHDDVNLREQTKGIQTDDFERLARVYSIFVLVFLSLLPTVIFFTAQSWNHSIVEWAKTLPPAVLRLSSIFLFTMPKGIELDGWHIARTLNALLTIALWLYIRKKIAGLERNPDAPASKAIDGWMMVRRVLSVYTIACTVYIIVTTVNWQAIPPIHVRWLP